MKQLLENFKCKDYKELTNEELTTVTKIPLQRRNELKIKNGYKTYVTIFVGKY